MRRKLEDVDVMEVILWQLHMKEIEPKTLYLLLKNMNLTPYFVDIDYSYVFFLVACAVIFVEQHASAVSAI